MPHDWNLDQDKRPYPNKHLSLLSAATQNAALIRNDHTLTVFRLNCIWNKFTTTKKRKHTVFRENIRLDIIMTLFLFARRKLQIFEISYE